MASAERQNALALDQALKAAVELPSPPPTTFAALGVPAALVAELASRGISEPFAIQSRAMPDALAGRDVLGRAQTGSGKTLAFGLPMLTRLSGLRDDSRRRSDKAPRGLVLVPTRELALQVADVLVPLGQALGTSVMTVHGGVALGPQIHRLSRGVDVVVATPGRLIDLMDRGSCTLDEVSVTVLDEADHMADLGFLPSVTRILDATPAGQRLLFSATLDRGVAGLVSSYLNDPALHAIASAVNSNNAEHQVFVVPVADKLAIATEIGTRQGRTLFFVRTKHGADRLARQLTVAGVDAAAIHGNLKQNQRLRALAGFASGNPRVLVATDVAARGIHVEDVGLVVHYDPPEDHKDYLHRSGRTARAGASGTVLTLVEPGQVRAIGRMHDTAGITSVCHQVEPGHMAVRELAGSGTPIVQVEMPPRVSVQPRGGAGRRARAASRPVRHRARDGARANSSGRAAAGRG
ncbi:MAG TPA: DEAD/DEAH box helicase [Streptosporangiaceae bacterium]|nr:DEAD/DEAH box helicase [Streptosporangiaceae bacterium]